MTSTISPAQLDHTAERLRKVFNTGRTRPLAWRREQLKGLRSMLIEREEDFLAALATDLGKPRLEAWVTEIGFTINEINLTLKNLKRWTKPKRVSTPMFIKPGSGRVIREPLGTVLVIAPWNYPLQLALAPLIGALAAGNTVALKPSEISSATSNTIARLVPQYVDAEAVSIVEGGVSETQNLLQQKWDYIFYTGNGAVGRQVMAAAGQHLTPVTLELGGKSPAIIDKSANLEVAGRRLAWGKFLNSGQTCIAPDYALVDKSVKDELVKYIQASITDFYGSDPSTSPDYARIINDRHFGRLTALIDSGSVLIGGQHDGSTRFIAPTVLDGISGDSAVMQEEIFGPILPLITVDSSDEAIAFINERDKPLALYVFAQDDKVIDQVLDQTSSGGVCVNGVILQVAAPNLPFGGVGESGMGNYHGRASFDIFTHAKPVLRRGTRPDPALAYPPYTKKKEKMIRRFS